MAKDCVNDKITAGLEDYLEAVYIAETQNKSLKSVELAKELNISRASVSEALSKLVNKGLIEYESFGNVKLTSKGRIEAKSVYEKHNILKTFFENVLDIDSKEASDNACKIEHVISSNILNKIMDLTTFCKENPEIIKKFKNK